MRSLVCSSRQDNRRRGFFLRQLTLLSVLLVLIVAVSGPTWGRLGGASSAERETHQVRTGGASAVLTPVKASNVASMPSTVTTMAPTTVTVNAGPDTDAVNNDYRRIQNALNAAVNGDTIILSGTFDFTAPFAAAAWAAGNDGIAGNSDDYEVSAPRGINNVTLTANSLGSATIQGPGDLPAIDLEAFLVFDASLAPGGGAQGWTISNLRILDFDLSIGMFAVGVSDYNNTTITNNFVRIPNDLNATVAPSDTLQNIGLHFSFGTNQSITGNSFQTPGDGVSNGGNFSSIVVMQSNQSGGAVYNGLTISNNVIHVLNAQSANPEVIVGIWDECHAHTSNITISNNSFINDAAGNNPAMNQQRAFRVTSHSGASSLVKYDSNTVSGANIGFQWITGSNFAGNQAVVLTGNQITNSDTSVLIQSNGIAHLENNVITGSGSGGGIHLITGMLTGSPAAFPANPNSIYRSFVSGGSGDGILIDATAGSVSQLSQNDLSGNTGFALHNLSAPAIVAESNWWGNNLAANVAAKVSGPADFDPWLASGTDVSAAFGFQPFIYATTTTAANLTTLAGTAAADTGSMLNTNPVTFTMDGDTGFVPVAQLLNVSIQLGNSDDVFTLGQTGIPTVFDGGAGNDTLVGTNVAQTWNITGANSGNIPGATSSFINVESLRGGTAVDAFVFGAAGSVGQTIDGNLGTDTLDNSAIPAHTITPTGPGTLDGFKGTATGVGVGFDNINLPSPSSVSGTKTVSGTFAPNGSITYTVVLSNSSAFAQLDNPGNEFSDVLPATLTLVSASATGGTAVATVATRTVTWNGTIAGSGSVTITITATINGGTGGAIISNQGTINYDADGNATNESSRLTDDPAVAGSSDPTTFTVQCVNIVTNTNDSGAGSLRQAITDANNSPCTDPITFQAGVTGTITLLSALPDLSTSMQINGPGAGVLTVSGNNSVRVFNIQAGSTVTISDLTIANGKVNGATNGGGVLNGGALTLTNCNLYGSNTASRGGGIYSDGPSLTVNNCNIGGAVSGQANSAISSGAGIFNNSGTLTMTGGSIVGNGAGSMGGGGIQVAGGTATLNGVAVTQNHAFISFGGGIGSTGGVTNVVNSLVASNTASGGGAIFNNGGTVTAANCTISGNTATGSGGGVRHDLGTLSLTNATLTNNRSDSDDSGAEPSGGIFRTGGTVTLRNAIVAGNFRGTGSTADDIGGTVDAASSFNLIGAGGAGGLTNGTNNNQVGVSNPLLGALAANGGLTQTNALLPGSPAIDAGSNAFITNPPFSGPPFTDQRGTGFNRIVNSAVDIGAFESRGFTIALTSGSGQSTPILSAFGSPLVATVSSGFSEPIAGGVVTFTAPSSGASGTFAGNVNTATTNASGVATSSTLTANGTAGGPYNVVAGIGTGLPTVNFALTNSKGNQTITVGTHAPANATYNTSFTVAATSTSGLTVAYSSAGVCTNVGATFTMTSGTGTCTVKYDQAGDGNYNAATQVTELVTAQKASQALTIGTHAPANATYNTSFTVAATSNSALAVAYSSAGVCTNVGATFTMTSGTGTCTVTYDQAGNTNFNAATQVTESVTAQKANQTITVGTHAPANATYNTNFTVAATSTSALAVAYSSAGVCTNVGATFTMSNGTGTCTVRYDQAGNTNFNAATQVTEFVTAQKAAQAITFGTLANKTFGDPDFTVSATSDSSLGVSFAASGQCTIAGTTVHLTGPGSCTITAKQAGDTNFNAAADVPQSFTINGALVSLSQANYPVNESTGFVTITVNRTGDLSVPVTVDYATDDTGSSNVCSTLNSGLASSRCDFGSTLGTLKFAATETQKTFVIPITQDSYTEGPEMFTVNLSNLTGTGAAFASPSSATVTINDSTAPAPNASDDTDAFVRQHYRDFLNRDADPAGLAFWTNQITSCGNDATCIAIKRINVSAAFFLSIEFQQTGNLVRSFYVAALDRPLTNNMPGFVEFERDTQAMQRGVIVDPNNNAWQAILNANRSAFMNDFVMRAEFVGLYPTTDAPAQYVDKVYLHANVTPGTPAERQAAIDEFAGAGTAADPGARGRSLLRITQNTAFQQREMNRSFVQMEYFGYLRRNPNDAPDGDFTGYNFWLNKLNAAGGNYVSSEMVKAFLVSSEYRRRFGPN